MPQLDQDSFTYSDGALAGASGAKWTKLSGFTDVSVASNQVTGNGGNCVAVITTWSGSTTDQYSQITTATSAAPADNGGPTVRSNAVDTFYLCYGGFNAGSQYSAYKCVGGVYTSIGTAGGTPSSGDVVYIEMQGSTIVCKENGGTIITVSSESSIASGKPGIQTNAAAAKSDDWVAGDFAVGDTSTPFLNFIF
jgi:hypothetical protein